MNRVTISKIGNKSHAGEIHLPASKSISNRALIIDHLSGNIHKIHNLSQAEDTILMKSLLESVKENRDNPVPVILDCNNSGTVFRFLTALLSKTQGWWLLTGNKRMQERPVGELVNSLNQLGARIHYENKTGFPPLLIEGTTIPGGEIEMDGSISSQFITSLMLIAPVLKNGLAIRLHNKISSFPYVQLTLQLLNSFGIKSTFKENLIRIDHQEFKPCSYTVETDWSSASYWFEIAALSDKPGLFLTGLTKDSIQGDAILPEIYASLGVKTEFHPDGIKLTREVENVTEYKFDFTGFPDLAPAVIVTCAGLNIRGEFTGLESLRIKESDRIVAVKNELNKLGFRASLTGNSGIKIIGSTCQEDDKFHIKKLINTYGDHRIAMAFAPLALIHGTLLIEDPGVVSKSYPGYWQDLIKAGFELVFNEL